MTHLSEPPRSRGRALQQRLDASLARERRLIEALQRIELAREAAEKANAAKSAFLADMSHELRTPLNGVLTMADLLAGTALDERQREMVALIRSSGDLLLGSINDLLDFSKIEAGEFAIEDRPFDLAADLFGLFEISRMQALGRGLGLQVEDLRTDKGWYRGDSVRVRQVVNNLLSNALKFTETGGVTVTITDAPFRDERCVRISIKDTGVGMTADAHARLFERFQQADNSISRRFGGTGLGLTISRGLARLLGGDIVCETVLGEGSQFDFTFLAERVAPPIAANVNAPASEVALPARALVAEDNAGNRRVFEMILEMAGVQVTFCENGMEACAQAISQAFDVILMDLEMPVMGGLEAIRSIRAREADLGLMRVPIVAVSANAMSHHVKEALEAGADAHVAKPIEASALLAELRRF